MTHQRQTTRPADADGFDIEPTVTPLKERFPTETEFGRDEAGKNGLRTLGEGPSAPGAAGEAAQAGDELYVEDDDGQSEVNSGMKGWLNLLGVSRTGMAGRTEYGLMSQAVVVNMLCCEYHGTIGTARAHLTHYRWNDKLVWCLPKILPLQSTVRPDTHCGILDRINSALFLPFARLYLGPIVRRRISQDADHCRRIALRLFHDDDFDRDTILAVFARARHRCGPGHGLDLFAVRQYPQPSLCTKSVPYPRIRMSGDR